ncbi:MAG: lytic transglycosylase domain-containing protein [Acidobacteriota bacterium]
MTGPRHGTLVALLAALAVVTGVRADTIYRREGGSGPAVLTNIPQVGREWRTRPDRTRENRPARVERRVATVRPYDDAIHRIAAHYEVDPRLVHAIIEVESGYDARAVSSRGAVGLMQVMPDTAREVGILNPGDPYANIVAGVRHLRDLLDRYEGDVDLALAAYNAGAGAVRRHGGVPPYQETRRYVERVRRIYDGPGRVVRRREFTRYVDGSGTLVITQFPARSVRTPPGQ